jgi:probable HAF family extracellular repeat protein
MFSNAFRRQSLVLAAALLIPLASVPAASATPATWQVTDLGAGDHSSALAINDRGHVVGIRNDNAEAFLWRDGRLTNLGAFRPTDINNRDEIVGYRSDGETARAVVWRDGAVTELATPAGRNSYATALNDRGEIVGWTMVASQGIPQAVSWRDGVLTSLSDDEASIAQDINNRGQIVGGTGAFLAEVAVRWWHGTETRLNVTRTQAWAVNRFGTATGPYWTDTSDAGFVWQRGRFIEIPPVVVEDNSGTQPYGINGRTQVVGVSAQGGFVWEKGRITTLPALARTPGGAFDINEDGVIAGACPTTMDGLNSHAVIWSRSR